MRFSGSKALSESFAIFGSRFVPMAIIGAVFTFIPLLVFFGFFASQLPSLAAASGNPGAMITQIGGMIGQFLLLMLVYIALRALGSLASCIVAADSKGISVGDAIGEGSRALLPLLGVILLLFLAYIVFAVVMVAVIGASFAGAFAGNTTPGAGTGLSIVLLALGLLVLVMWLAVKLSMVLPVIAIDKERNPIAAMSRSWSLTNGASFKIFLVFALVLICTSVISFVVDSLAGTSPLEQQGLSGGGIAAGMIISFLLGTAISIYFTTLIVAIHRQLSGPSTGEVTETFS